MNLTVDPVTSLAEQLSRQGRLQVMLTLYSVSMFFGDSLLRMGTGIRDIHMILSLPRHLWQLGVALSCIHHPSLPRSPSLAVGPLPAYSLGIPIWRIAGVSHHVGPV